jgi:hypothetical protein
MQALTCFTEHGFISISMPLLVTMSGQTIMPPEWMIAFRANILSLKVPDIDVLLCIPFSLAIVIGSLSRDGEFEEIAFPSLPTPVPDIPAQSNGIRQVNVIDRLTKAETFFRVVLFTSVTVHRH